MMPFHSPLLLLVGFVVVLSTASSVLAGEELHHDPPRTLYFESHGRDDLREMRAAILKGAQYIKIDLNFQSNPSNCVKQRRVNPLGLNESAFPNGCFLWAHYWSPFTLDFNSTDDLADFLSTPSTVDLLSFASGHPHIVFQLCFKNKPALCPTSSSSSSIDGQDNNNDDEAAKWKTLMDAFYAKFNPFVWSSSSTNSSSLNIEFVFDSLSYHTDRCVIDQPSRRWPGWNSTWTGNFATAVVGSSHNHDIFQMVNMAYDWTSKWSRLEANSFYKFAQSRYAFVSWEPSYQNQIARFYAPYLASGMHHAPGMIMAYNADPAMYHVFTSNETRRFAHFPLPQSSEQTQLVDGSSASSTSSPKGATGSSKTMINSKITAAEHGRIVIVCAEIEEETTTAVGSPSRIQCTALERLEHSQQRVIGVSRPLALGSSNTTTTAHLEAIQVDGEEEDTTMMEDSRTKFSSSASSSSSNTTTTKTLVIIDSRACFHLLRWKLQQSGEGGKKKVVFDSKFTNTSLNLCFAVGAELLAFGLRYNPSYGIVTTGLGWTNNNNNTLLVSAFSLKFYPQPHMTQLFVKALPITERLSDGPSSFSEQQMPKGHHLAEATEEKYRRSAQQLKKKAPKRYASSDDDNSFEGTITGTVSGDGKLIIVPCWSRKRSVFCSTIIVTNFSSTNEGLQAIISPAASATPVKVGVGRAPSVTLHAPSYGSADEARLLLFYGDSFCYNAQLVDDDMILFWGQKICNLQDSPIFEIFENPVQSYVFGFVSNFTQRLNGVATGTLPVHRNGFATTCDDELFHGVYDLGYGSAPLLLPRDDSIDFDVASPRTGTSSRTIGNGFIAVSALTSLSEPAICVCGGPEPAGGRVMVDSFPLMGFYNTTSAAVRMRL